ncbi:MAG: pilin, partial [Candidatus Paceibacterota bacterium]
MFCFLLLPGLVIAQSSQPNPAIFNPNPDSESPPMNTYNPDIYNPNQDTDPAPMNTYNPDVYNPQDYSQPSPSTYNFTQDSSQPSPSIYEPDERYGLVPCGSPGQQPCTTEDVVKFANNLITWLISILGVIAVIALMIVGFKLVTSAGNPSAWAEAKGMFTNIVIGIIIILAAWLVVDTIMKGL